MSQRLVRHLLAAKLRMVCDTVLRAIAYGDGAGGFGSVLRHGSSGIPIGAGFPQVVPPGYLELTDLVVHPIDDRGGKLALEFVVQF